MEIEAMPRSQTQTVQHLNIGFIQVHSCSKLLHMMEKVISPLHLIKVKSQGDLHHGEF